MGSSFGHWSDSVHGLPQFTLTAQDNVQPEAGFTHLISTGRLSSLVDRYANIRPFTTTCDTGIKWFCGQGETAIVFRVIDGEEILWQSGWQFGGSKTVRYSTGSAEYFFQTENFNLSLAVAAFADDSAFLRIEYKLDSPADEHLRCEYELLSPDMRVHSADFSDAFCGVLNIGFGKYVHDVVSGVIERSHTGWAEELSHAWLNAPEDWIRRECCWTMGQLLSFRNYDGLLDEHYMNLGGYGWGEFAGRECSEVALSLAKCYPRYARENLRWVAKTQFADGRLPRVWDFTKNFTPQVRPGLADGIPRPDTSKELWASDQEIWFVLSCMETMDFFESDLLGEKVSFADDVTAAEMWEHCRRAFYWVRDGIGVGEHGLIRMLHGDWNDYLSGMGLCGRGESCMNSGMACRAFAKLSVAAFICGDDVLGNDAKEFASQLKNAMNGCFTGTHFLRGYNDAGQAVGGEERVFLNAQTWAVLGGCGTVEQRKRALKTALCRCDDSIGLCLMSDALVVPSPRNVTHCDYPAGRGENAGIWPQTVYWSIWALCEEGLCEEAMVVWEKMSLRNHSLQFPDVPYGIFNGPDCYNSHLAGAAHGATQVELIDRRGTVPMNPVIAWQAWAMDKILQLN